jgi:hypothetical protein
MAITLNGSTGITDADGGTVLNTNDLASQAQAEAGTDNTTVMTPLRTAQAIVSNFNASGSAPLYACRAWVNFNGLSGAVIRASGNVASVSRTSTGNYVVTFTTAMQDANYVVVANAVTSATGQMIQYQAGVIDYATGSFRIYTSQNGTSTNVKADCEIVSIAVFR